jgi:hypothetical protein
MAISVASATSETETRVEKRSGRRMSPAYRGRRHGSNLAGSGLCLFGQIRTNRYGMNGGAGYSR